MFILIFTADSYSGTPGVWVGVLERRRISQGMIHLRCFEMMKDYDDDPQWKPLASEQLEHSRAMARPLAGWGEHQHHRHISFSVILADHHDHDLPAGKSHLRLLQLQLCLVRMVRVGSLLSIMQCGHSGQYLHKTTPTWNWTLRYARGRSCRVRLDVQQGRRRRENAVQGIALETVGGVHGAHGTLAQ